MAAIERGEGADDSVVLGWLTKALTASRGPQWCCDNCQSIHTQWQPGCQNCAGFDTLSWREPPQSLSPSVTQAELLPLLVRTPNAIQEKGTSDEIEPKDSDVVDTQNLAHNIN
jgi:HemY protein